MELLNLTVSNLKCNRIAVEQSKCNRIAVEQSECNGIATSPLSPCSIGSRCNRRELNRRCRVSG